MPSNYTCTVHVLVMHVSHTTCIMDGDLVQLPNYITGDEL